MVSGCVVIVKCRKYDLILSEIGSFVNLGRNWELEGNFNRNWVKIGSWCLIVYPGWGFVTEKI